MKMKIYFCHISLSFLIMKNASDKLCKENKNTYFMINKFFSKNFR